MIHLVGLFPEHLNLNGDFGNLAVLQQQLTWRGLDAVTVAASSAKALTEETRFVLIGHGSTAAWVDIESKMTDMLPTLRSLRDSGVPILAVSTGYEFLVRAGFFKGETTFRSQTRVSKFEIVDFEGREVLGYVNTDVDLPVLQRSGSAIGTMLHGPVLAKNADLCEDVLKEICSLAGLTLPRIQASEKAGLLADLIEAVWKLESQLANE